MHAVIITTRPGSYEHDGWSDDSHTTYRYSFKAQKGVISFTETANRVLIEQPHHGYPLLLFSESAAGWQFEGRFSVVAIEESHVVLSRDQGAAISRLAQEEIGHSQGARKFVTHLMAERSQSVVRELKDNQDWTCDICGGDFLARYGVAYIGAHHKVPISTYAATHQVAPGDLALLCANCHRAVHIYMRRDGLDYPEINAALRGM